MKFSHHLFSIILILLIGIHPLKSQCEPDPDCEDINEPGEICPPRLPDGVVDEDYNAAVTVIAPGTVEVLGQIVDIAYILVDSITQLPEGITYQASTDLFYPDSSHCILISGTPLEEGVYPLAIHVTAYIKGPSDIPTPTPPVVNDTSVVLTITGPASLNPNQYREFQLLPHIPNPFSGGTRIGFYTPFDERMELTVYNMLGVRMHREIEGFPPGEHYFSYEGHELEPGTYIYHISNQKEVITGKIVKVRK
jgi:hypothetical protein